MNNEIRIITKLSNGLLLKPRSRTIFFSSFFRREYKRERNNGDPVPPVDFSIHDPITSRVSMLPTSSFSTSNESLIVDRFIVLPSSFRFSLPDRDIQIYLRFSEMIFLETIFRPSTLPPPPRFVDRCYSTDTKIFVEIFAKSDAGIS